MEGIYRMTTDAYISAHRGRGRGEYGGMPTDAYIRAHGGLCREYMCWCHEKV